MLLMLLLLLLDGLSKKGADALQAELCIDESAYQSNG